MVALAARREVIKLMLKSKKWAKRLDEAETFDEAVDTIIDFIDARTRQFYLYLFIENVFVVGLLFGLWWVMIGLPAFIVLAATTGASIVAWDIQFSGCWRQ